MKKQFVLAVCIIAAGISFLSAEENKEKPLLNQKVQDQIMESQFLLKVEDHHQEEVEVTAPEYPGLNIELPTLAERLKMPKPQFLRPSRTTAYYQQGGQILSFWGIPMDSSELISTSLVEH